ncbi:formylglycine-generating enzyme family protein [Pseudomonas sp. NFXW11]|uniref:formylglycine-generating enzyme family protein n=1 Tax=Pseudomonas sp. NFXW11 TaxID=2819531 RepID=UPI003CEB29AD
MTLAVAALGLVAGLSLGNLLEWGQPPQDHLLCQAYSGVPALYQGPWRKGMRWVEGGHFTLGSDRFYAEEGPAQRVQVSGFWIDVHPVSNAQYAAFVAATGYRTLAERGIDARLDPSLGAGAQVPGSMVFRQGSGQLKSSWQFVEGASWRHPEGPGSAWQGRHNHPVVHVAYEDALAYAHWLGRELPSEAQLEYAARGGLEDADFSWGMHEPAAERYLANTWQGRFPYQDLARDGFRGTSPVGCFPANGFGLFDMAGNVWQLTRTWYRPGHGSMPAKDPEGPVASASFDPRQPGVPVRVIKGGSHLCSADACLRYRPSARQPQVTYMGASHLGFRTLLAGPPAP